MTQSISFDRAADTYDETRALPEDVARKQTDVLVAELGAVSAPRLLEVGIGTGRIARPVAARGVPVVGVDISTRMLARLRAQIAPSSAPVGVLLGDATRLPIATSAFRAALIVHVLHLVADWRATLSEVRRVLVPGGVLIHDATHYSQNNPWQQVFAKRTELLKELGFVPRGRPSNDDIASYMTSLGATQRRVTYAERDDREVANEVIDRARRRVDSWTWEIPDAIYPAFLAQYEQHASDVLGGLDATNVTHVAYGIDVWTFA